MRHAQESQSKTRSEVMPTRRFTHHCLLVLAQNTFGSQRRQLLQQRHTLLQAWQVGGHP